MNGDFGTSVVLGTLLARGSVKNQDKVAQIGLTAGLAGGTLGLVIAKTLADEAAAQEGRPTAARSPGEPSPPPEAPAQAAPPPVNQSTESRAVLGELQKQTATLGKAGDALKGVAGELRIVSKSMAASSARLESAAKALVSQKAV